MFFVVSVIERRLQDLQRKLSEIAEIPKILSSTLATVSQTFNKLTTTLPPTAQPPLHCRHHFPNGNADCHHFLDTEQKRKLSYDEDIYDYELSDDENKTENDADNEQEFDAKEAYLQLKRYAARQRKSKDITPESDYASESNFPQKEPSSNVQDDFADDNSDIYDDNDLTTIVARSAGDDDNEQNRDMYEEFNFCMLQTPFGHFTNGGQEFDEDDDDDDENNSKDDEDFLTTTFTWSLRNKPKLQLMNGKDNNADGDDDADVVADNVCSQQQDNEQIDVADKDKDIAEQQMSTNNSQNVSNQKPCKADTPEKEQQKMDKLERSWPWADREKIIYKQSTCHLVPHKPLGLIEQRIQLLAKRNLLEHINRIKNPQ